MTVPTIVRFALVSAALAAPPSVLASTLEPTGPAPAPADEPGRLLACEIPLRWQIEDVDTRFGLSEDEAARAVRQAGMLWEAAMDRVLMFQESSDGIPVSFVYDERQQMTRDRQEREDEIGDMAAEVAESRRGLDRLTAELERMRGVYETRTLTYEGRRASLEELVEYWNARGGPPPQELARLRETEAEVESYRRRANEAASEVNEIVDRVNAATDALNAAIGGLNDARSDLEARFPRMTVESAHYRDERSGLGRLILSREREIQVFQFEDWDHLLLVIAHELGHALGLEHSGMEGALMAESAIAIPGQGPPRIHPADVEQLRELCPQI